MLKKCCCIVALAAILPVRPSPAASVHWPVMRSINAKFAVKTDQNWISIKLPLKDVQGVIRYTLFCEGGSQDYLDKLSDTTGITYVGPFACRLVPGERNSELSLLSEDDQAYWYSRGQLYDYKNILGACGRYPEYGALRYFRLRGFELTLKFQDIVVDKQGEPTSFNLLVSVRPDSKITSAMTEQPGYRTPYVDWEDCDQVYKGDDPLWCLSDKEGWEKCDDMKASTQHSAPPSRGSGFQYQ